jgi:hypothetical protein
MIHSPSRPSTKLQTSKLLWSFLEQHEGEKVFLRDLIHYMGDRAFAPTLLVCALPEALPLPVAGVSAIIAIPLMLVSAQLLLGFPSPRLPKWIANRSIARKDFEKIVCKVLPYLEKVERVIRPRWQFFTTRKVERLLGLLLLVLGIIIALPIPLGNMLPAIAIVVICLGAIEKDGAVVVLGVVGACAILTLMAGAIFAFLSIVFARLERQ